MLFELVATDVDADRFVESCCRFDGSLLLFTSFTALTEVDFAADEAASCILAIILSQIDEYSH